MDTTECLRRLKKRDQKAFAQIVDEYSRLLWTVAGRYLPKASGFSAEDVEECVSDALFELWERPERYDPARGTLKTYLCMVARNRAISLFRKRSKERAASLGDREGRSSTIEGVGADGMLEVDALFDADGPCVEDGICERGEAAGVDAHDGPIKPAAQGPFSMDDIRDGDKPDYRALYSAIAELPEPTREVLIRRYFHEEKPAAIAEKTGLPKKEVENRLYRAKRSIARALSQKQEERR